MSDECNVFHFFHFVLWVYVCGINFLDQMYYESSKTVYSNLFFSLTLLQTLDYTLVNLVG
jgi:hypothetical protein